MLVYMYDVRTHFHRACDARSSDRILGERRTYVLIFAPTLAKMNAQRQLIGVARQGYCLFCCLIWISSKRRIAELNVVQSTVSNALVTIVTRLRQLGRLPGART
jgi:hypothetical protein